MKMSKRIFLVLLTVAFLVCGFAFTASADEVTLENYENILHYYEEPIIFALDFSRDGVDYTDDLLVSNPSRVTYSVIEDPAVSGGKYLNTQISNARPMGQENLYFNWNSENGTDDFYLDTTVSGEKSGSLYAPEYRVIVSDEMLTDVSAGRTSGHSLLRLNFNDGTVYYSSLVVNDDSTVVKEIKAEYTLVQGSWYNISLTYVAGESCVVTITDANDDANSITISDVYLPYELVKNVRFGVHGTDTKYSNGNIIKVARLEAAGGTVRRNVHDVQGAVEAGILDIYNIYKSDDVSIEEKIGLCQVINKVVNVYGFTTDNVEVNTAIADLRFGSVTLYSDELAEFVEILPTTRTYDEKKALVEEYKSFADTLSDMDLSPVGEEAAAVIEANIDALYGEEIRLARTESNSLDFIASLDGVEEVIDSEDYAVLTEWYSVASAYDNEYLDTTYAGVAEVYVHYEHLKDSILDIKYEGDYYISMVDRANNDSLTFLQRYETYLLIEETGTPNETYPGVTEALTVYTDSVAPYITYEIGLVNNFLLYVSRADYSIYVSAKQENLDIAAQYMNICEPTFTGVAEAKVLFAEIQEFIDQQVANAEAYVASVNAIDGLSGDELLVAIENAKKLQEAGNVLGVPGVTEANIKLNKTISAIELSEKYCIHFISLVNSLDNTKDLAALYEIFADAKAAEADADASYPGVADASAKLKKSIEDLDAQINKANDIFEAATAAAANTSGIGKTSNSVADHVIAIIKKFFDDEE